MPTAFPSLDWRVQCLPLPSFTQYLYLPKITILTTTTTTSAPMAASLPTTSSAGSRRLSELLEEQQEPFFLGISPRILEAQDATLCWPWGPSKRWQSFSGRLSRIFGQTHERFSFSRRMQGHELDTEHQRRCTEVREAEQLSPVSVLQLPSCDSSPVDSHSKEEDPSKTLQDVIFGGILMAAYDPALDSYEEEEEVVPLEGRRVGVAGVSRLIERDMVESCKDWNHGLHAERSGVGIEIEGTIFEEIVQEILHLHCIPGRCLLPIASI